MCSTFCYGVEYVDCWKNVPNKYHERYNEICANIDQKWVLAFADSLDDLADKNKFNSMHYYAAEIRCHYYYYKEDSLNFIVHNKKVCEWAKKCDFKDLYYCEMMNVVTFYSILNCKYQAQRSAQSILDEAKADKDVVGMYYGYSALGIVYSEKRDFAHAISNFKKAIECCDQVENTTAGAKSQILWYISSCYYECLDYKNAIENAKQAYQLDPSAEEAMVVLAKSYYHLGMYEDFLSLYPKIQSCTTYNATTHGEFIQQVTILKYIIEKRYTEALAECPKLHQKKDVYAFSIEVYRHMNDWENAYACQDSLINIQNSLSHSMHLEEMIEMSSEFESINKTFEIDAQLQRHRYMLIVFIILIICSIMSGVFIYMRYKTAKVKNKALGTNIDQLLKYKNMALSLEKEKYEHMEVLRPNDAVGDEQNDSESDIVMVSENSENELSNEPYDIEKEKIRRFIYEITSRKLFVDPNFNRDTLIEELHIQKRSFTKFFEAYTKSTFKEFITGIRLEYAAQLIKERPEYTIEAIAAECGITSYVTFHRNFTRYFGIAPSSYRNQS